MSQTYEDIDLCFLFIDYGDQFLRQATTEMLRSAMRAMPGINVVQLHDSKSRVHPFANAALRFEEDVTREQLCGFKAFSFSQAALRATKPTLFCDVDLIYNGSGAADELRTMDAGTVAVLHRENKEFACQPYNAGMILYKPAAPLFWEEYARMADSLPLPLREWYGDQFALAALIGHPSTAGRILDAKVKLLPMDDVVPAPYEMPKEKTHGWACHMKGQVRKQWLVKYARLLDGGKHFEDLDPNRFDEIVHETA